LAFFQSILLYIDPGVGSLAVQVIVAGFAAFMFFFKNTFRKLFSRSKKTINQEEREN
jgi:hypothetical protein